MKNFRRQFITIILSCYAIFLFYLLSSGSLKKFINPKLSFLSVAALLIICAMLFSNLTKNHGRSTHSSTYHCCHHEEKKLGTSSLLLFLPILLSLMIPPATLSYQIDQNTNFKNTSIVQSNDITTSVINKNGVIVIKYKNPNQFNINLNNISNQNPASGNNQNPANQNEKAQDISAQFVPAGYEEYTQLNIGDTIFDTLKEPKQKLTHTKIFLRGKIINSPLLKNDEIILYRMVITCCVADGMPLGIVVKLPGKLDFQPNEWVGVEGTIQLLPFNEKLKSIDPIVAMVPPEKIYPYFAATKAYQVQPPRDEYLYP